MGKRNTWRWFGRIERMNSEEFVKKVYVSEIEGPGRRGRSLGRWKNRVKQCMSESGATRGGVLEQARRDCLDRERWRLFCRGHRLGNVPGGIFPNCILVRVVAWDDARGIAPKLTMGYFRKYSHCDSHAKLTIRTDNFN